MSRGHLSRVAQGKVRATMLELSKDGGRVGEVTSFHYKQGPSK